METKKTELFAHVRFKAISLSMDEVDSTPLGHQRKASDGKRPPVSLEKSVRVKECPQNEWVQLTDDTTTSGGSSGGLLLQKKGCEKKLFGVAAAGFAAAA
nr:guanine nucleotide exchange factor DBS-like isoform X4 [Biomphalaria glabrata]